MSQVNHLAKIFELNAQKNPEVNAISFKSAGIEKQWSWSEVWDSIGRMAALYKMIGVQANCKVAIWSSNRPEWCFADIAIMTLGGASVPVYTTLAPKEIVYILQNSQSRILVVENVEKLSQLDELLDQLDQLWAIVLIDGRYEIRNPNAKQKVFEMSSAQGLEASTFEADSLSENDIATIIYTSGTTGLPKGVVLTHKNFLHNVISVAQNLAVKNDDLHLSFLPLSHVFERMCGYYLMAYVGSGIAYAQNFNSVIEDAAKYKPTFLLAVPRFYEKVCVQIQKKIDSAPQWKQNLFGWATGVGRKRGEVLRRGDKLSLWARFQWKVAMVLVFKKIHRVFGGRVRFCVSGGAPLDQEMSLFFESIGLLIIEGYGLTETSPVIAMNRLDKYRFGTVGLPLDGVQIKISENSEILTKSDSVMKSYYHDEVATKNAMVDGWFRTGDQGAIDSDGFLRITGRIKEIIVLSGGKKLCPTLIEAQFEKTNTIQTCVLYGEGKNFLTALILPDSNYFAKILQIDEKDESKLMAEIIKNPKTKKMVQADMDKSHLNMAPYEQIKYFEFIHRDFTIEDGELTPTLKLKRGFVAKQYGHLLDVHYASCDA